MKVQIKCQICGDRFECYPSVSKKRKTCSRKCKGRYLLQKRGRLSQIKCKFCNKEFEYNNIHNSKFCTIECYKQYRKKSNHVLFKQGKVKNRDSIYRILSKTNNKCAICGLTQWQNKKIRLWVDHINGNKFDNMPDNLRLVCPNCESQLDTSRGRNQKKYS